MKLQVLSPAPLILGLVANDCNPSHSRGRGRRTEVQIQGCPWLQCELKLLGYDTRKEGPLSRLEYESYDVLQVLRNEGGPLAGSSLFSQG